MEDDGRNVKLKICLKEGEVRSGNETQLAIREGKERGKILLIQGNVYRNGWLSLFSKRIQLHYDCIDGSLKRCGY